MMRVFLRLAKIFCTYWFNGLNICKLGRYAGRGYIGRGLMVHGHEGISINKNVRIGRWSRLSCYYNINNKLGTIEIGENCYIGDFFSVMSCNKVILKPNVLVASYVSLLGENHGMNASSTELYGKQPLKGEAIIIESECWIGEKVIIMQGVHIGERSIIGAGSLVTKDIPAYSIAVGNPAKVIKRWDFNKQTWVKV